MKTFFATLLFVVFCSHAEDLKQVETQYEIVIDGQAQSFLNGETRAININGTEVKIGLQLGKFKTFENYGISFQVPVKTSAYLDESSQELDIWNFDYHDSVLMLMVLKESDFVINEQNLKTQMTAISESMGASLNGTISVSNGNLVGVSSTGTIGDIGLLIEQYGFENESYKFLAFTYFPLKEKNNREISDTYKSFKKVIFNSLNF